jgi:pyruvate/2-oxoglutarate dehydrogenase complex dihydrolipoamide acyltransferase (E2) component
MTTLLRRLALSVLVFLVWTPVAQAWSWPVRGPVVEPFAYDETHPYASGQHRGIDIGADAMGVSVVAPAAGTVSFAGTVPTSGKSVTIETADGYSVTLTHLGSIGVAEGASVAEGDEVGTIGPSGTPETDRPYVHLGIRTTADPNGYVDPLSFLPPVAETGGSDSGTTGAQPATPQPSASSGSASSTPPASQSQPAPPETATTPATPAAGSVGRTTRAHVSQRGNGHAEASHAAARPQRSSRRLPVSHPLRTGGRVSHHPRMPHRHVSEPAPAARRPVVEVAAPEEPTGLDTGHTFQPPAEVVPSGPRQRQASADLLALVLNGAAALVALAAAFAAARRRCRMTPIEGAQILHLPSASFERRRAA